MPTPFFIRIYGTREGGPLEQSMEVLAQKLESVPQLYFEWDGSFVWVGRESDDDTSWQFDGMIYDLGTQIQYIELKGMWHPQAWQRWLACLEIDSAFVHDITSGNWHSISQYSPSHPV
ncbi:MAG: hypothetical protein U0905_16070 [Pirellulales bacterium]